MPYATGTPTGDDEVAARERAALSNEACAPLAASYAEILGLKGHQSEKDAALAALDACKQGGGGGAFTPMSPTTDSCASGQGVACASNTIRHVPFIYFQVTNLSQVEVKTQNFSQLPGGSSPDTVLHVVQLTAGSWNAGTVLRINDDGNVGTPEPWDSLVTFTPTATGWYLVVVSAFDAGKEGYSDIVITANGATTTERRVFGGFRILPHEVKNQDVLVAGENTNQADMTEAPDYHDSTLFLFANSYNNCTSNCGAFQMSDDTEPQGGADRMWMSRIDVTSDMPTSRVLVGTYHGEYAPNVPYRWNGRMLHLRKHVQQGGNWGGEDQKDHDGDGLSRELEVALGSCDSASDAPSGFVVAAGLSCSGFGALVNTWVNAKHPEAACSTNPPSPYAFDITHGRFTQASSCIADNPPDRDEWLSMIAGGKASLLPRKEGYFSIYRDSFNAANSTPHNLDAWPLTVVNSGVVFDSAHAAFYERNVCHLQGPSGCATGQACIDDTCGAGKGCLNGQACSAGVCSCGNDADCRSGWCQSNICEDATRGGCGCAAAANCTCGDGETGPPGCCVLALGSCRPTRDALHASSTPGDRPPRESAEFGGPGSGDSLRVVNSGATSPIETIGNDNSFEIRFDFRWDSDGPTTQVLWASGAFTLTLYHVGNQGWLFANVEDNLISFPQGSVGGYLEPHRWYRVTWNATIGRGTHLLQVIAWNMRQAQYDPSLPESGCLWRGYTTDMTTVGDVWVGYDGSTDAMRFKGRMDAVQLRNYTMAVGAAQVPCVAW